MQFLFQKKIFTRLLFLLVFLFCGSTSISAQRKDADSIRQKLKTKLHDTMRVKSLRDLSWAMQRYQPDSALRIAYDGLNYAKKIKYQQGISNCYEIIAISLWRMGSYDKALNYFIENLKIEESLNSTCGMASAKNNMGGVYINLKDYEQALKSYLAADSLAKIDSCNDQQYSIYLNIGDVYDHLHKQDSAIFYTNKSLDWAIANKDNYKRGKSMLGIAHLQRNLKNYSLALSNYSFSLQKILEYNDEDLACDVLLGMANTFKESNQKDSSLYYARQGFYYAKKDNFLSWDLAFSDLLSTHFSEKRQYDSAYFYLARSNTLKDSVLSLEKTRTSQQIAFNENLRQIELQEKAKEHKKERLNQLQHLMIIMFIPTLFFTTLLLYRIRIKVAVIKFLTILSLLFLFEYLTLLLHPIVQKITHHTPLLEILIFVGIASLIIPTHHKVEHWMIEKLLSRVHAKPQKVRHTENKAK